MINFNKIRWKNFLSYGNHWTELNLNQNKSSLIIGENGAGKSTVLDALTFVLYNKPFRKVTVQQLINSINRPYSIVHQYDKRWDEFIFAVSEVKKNLTKSINN